MLAFALFSSLAAFGPPLPANAGVSGDRLLDRIIQSYREDAVPNLWDNSWMSAQRITRGGYVAGASGDERMAEILSVLTRDRLDAGGWANPYVNTQGYAAEYALLQVPIGAGSSSLP